MGRTAVAGTSGQLLRYRVAVEDGIENLDVARFAADVSDTLADPRSWTGMGQLRLQRVDGASRPRRSCRGRPSASGAYHDTVPDDEAAVK